MVEQELDRTAPEFLTRTLTTGLSSVCNVNTLTEWEFRVTPFLVIPVTKTGPLEVTSHRCGLHRSCPSPAALPIYRNLHFLGRLQLGGGCVWVRDGNLLHWCKSRATLPESGQ